MVRAVTMAGWTDLTRCFSTDAGRPITKETYDDKDVINVPNHSVTLTAL